MGVDVTEFAELLLSPLIVKQIGQQESHDFCRFEFDIVHSADTTINSVLHVTCHPNIGLR